MTKYLKVGGLHHSHNRLVAGSSPAGATKFQGLARNRRSFLLLEIYAIVGKANNWMALNA